MSKKSSKQKQQIVDYLMSIHYGVCAGPVDAIRSIRIGDMSSVGWTGFAIDNSPIYINNTYLFGGPTKMGGLLGTMDVMLGASDQEISGTLAADLGLAPSTAPAFRGLCSLFFHNGTAYGFMWSSNDPFLKGVWVEVQRVATDWYNATAAIARTQGLIASHPSVIFQTGATGNFTLKYDTYGDFMVYSEGVIRVFSIPTGATLWSITTSGVLGGGAFLMSDGTLVHMEATGGIAVKWRNAADGTLLQSFSVVGEFFANLSFIDFFDDITVDGIHYMWDFSWDGFGGCYFLYFQQDPSDASWSLVTPITQSAFGASLGANPALSWSIGVNYAYGIFNYDLTQMWLVTLPGLVDTFITPAGLTGPMVMCHYDQTNDLVLIMCNNGDLFTFSANMSTMLNSNTGLGLTLAGGQTSTHIYTRAGVFGVVFRISGRNVLYEFSLPGLNLVRITDPGSAAAWSGGTTYAMNDVVTRSNSTYYSAIGNNVGNDPLISPYWIPAFLEYNNGFSHVRFNQTWEMAMFDTHFFDDYVWFLPDSPVKDMNPAHIIHEALTNVNWGMSTPTYALDDAAFTIAANTLYAEGFGLSLMFAQQATIEDFIKEILDHIEGVLFVDPQTGLIVLKLIRDDYDISLIPAFDETNSTIQNFQRKTWGDTTNEINVSWTNPETEETETITAQDLGNISIQGGIVSDSRNYYGVRTSALATTLALRDLRTASQPLASCSAEVNRTGWDLTPGGVIKMSSVEYGITAMAMRIINIDYGKPDDSKIKLTLMEDVFSKPTFDIVALPPSTAHVVTDVEPSPPLVARGYTLPYIALAGIEGVGNFDDPEVLAGLFVAAADNDTLQFDLWGPAPTAQGYLTTNVILSHATLTSDWVAEAVSTKTLADFTGMTNSQDRGPIVGGFMMIDGGAETLMEICTIDSKAGSNYVIGRGVLDTVPRAWVAGTEVWFFTSADKIHDPRTRSVGEVVPYHPLTRTSLGILPLTSSPVVNTTLTERPYLPSRPANCKIAGDGFGPVDGTVSPTTFAATWSRRNRLTEDAIVLAWDDADVSPEAGQTVTLRILYASNPAVVINNITGLTGTSRTLDYTADLHITDDGVIVEFIAVNGSLESLQSHRITIRLPGSDDDYAAWVAATGG